MKTLRIILLILIVLGVALLLTKNIWVPKLVNKIIEKEFKQEEIKTPEFIPISIKDTKINEENFSGTTSVISGTSMLAVKMREHIYQTISDFKTQANTEVPDIKKNFGDDVPSSTYEIYITSKYVKGPKTESIVTSVYTFTGGAHGSTTYKVMTANIENGRILSLSKLIKKDKQDEFTSLVKNKLNKWIPEGSETPVVFPDSVADLTFESFSNWAIDNHDLVIYFDQYAIGPGALGATEFKIAPEDTKGLENGI